MKGIFINIWQLVRFNVFKGKSYSLKIINCQLIGVMLWKNPEAIINLLLNTSE